MFVKGTPGVFHREWFYLYLCRLSVQKWQKMQIYMCVYACVCMFHYNGVIMSAMASQNTNGSVVCLAVYSGGDQRKHQNSASLAFVREIHRWPVDSPHKGPVTRIFFPFDDVIKFLRRDNLCSRMEYEVRCISMCCIFEVGETRITVVIVCVELPTILVAAFQNSVYKGKYLWRIRKLIHMFYEDHHKLAMGSDSSFFDGRILLKNLKVCHDMRKYISVGIYS